MTEAPLSFVPTLDALRPRPGEERGPTLVVEAEDQDPVLHTIARIQAATHALRGASAGLAALERGVRVAAMDRVARQWLDPTDPWRRLAEQVLPAEWAVSLPWLRWALDAAFSVVVPETLAGWVRPLPRATRTPSLHIWPSSVGTAGLPAVLASLLAGRPALVKAPAAQPRFAALFAASVADHAPELGPALASVAFGRGDQRAGAAFFAEADHAVVFGDAPSVEAIRATVRPGATLRAFGPRLSVAVVGPETPTDQEWDALVAARFGWEGEGCLCPRWVFVLGDMDRILSIAPHAVAAAERIEAAFPHRALDAGAGAAQLAFRGLAAWSGRLWSGQGWSVAAVPDLEHSLNPPARAVVLVPVSGLDAVYERLRPLGPVLQGAAVLGGVVAADAQRSLGTLGLSRAVAPSELQRPPLRWVHDGIDLSVGW